MSDSSFLYFFNVLLNIHNFILKSFKSETTSTKKSFLDRHPRYYFNSKHGAVKISKEIREGTWPKEKTNVSVSEKAVSFKNGKSNRLHLVFLYLP